MIRSCIFFIYFTYPSRDLSKIVFVDIEAWYLSLLLLCYSSTRET